MTKAELIDQMAKVAEVNKKEAEKVLSAFVQVVTENLSKGDEVLLVGFGNFIVRERSEREGHNPKTGERFMYQLVVFLHLDLARCCVMQ